jgi:hypothetical protein
MRKYMSALFEARATKERVLHLRECAEYVFSHGSSYNMYFFYNRQKNLTFMHRYQVAKYVIFDEYFSIQGKFYKNPKNFKCGCRKNSVCISCER